MKRFFQIAVIILSATILGIFLIQGKEETGVPKKKTKVGVILNGLCLDGSWGQAHYEGLEICAENLNLEMIYKENVPENEMSILFMDELIDAGCEIIVCDSFGYEEYLLEEAEKNPEIYFLHATGVVEKRNVATYFGRIYQMRYLSGIVAGMQTRTGQIGYVAAFPISEVNRGINAFTQGVRSVNPGAQVYVVWSDTWTGDEETEKATLKLLDAYPKVDVLAMHTDSLKVLDIAEERGIWSIGYNMDNREKYPNTFLTAPVWNWEFFYEQCITDCLQDKFRGKHYWEGVESGIVSLAPLSSNVKKGAEEIVDKEMKRLNSGRYDVFYGPIWDNTGVLRVESNTCMSDEAMLNRFDWYVDGVTIYEEQGK